MASFAENLRYYREKAGYSQKYLAEKIGVSVAAYNKYETRGNEPKISILMELATTLNVDVNTLVGFHPTLQNYLQTYMDHTKNLILKVDNGYTVILEIENLKIPKFFIPSDDLENIVNNCRKNTEKFSRPAFEAIEEVERQAFCRSLTIDLSKYLDKIIATHGTETLSKDSAEAGSDKK